MGWGVLGGQMENMHEHPLEVFVRLICEFSAVFQLIVHFPFLRTCSNRAVPSISLSFSNTCATQVGNHGRQNLGP